MGTADMEISHTVQTVAMVCVCVNDITINSLNINMKTDIDEVLIDTSQNLSSVYAAELIYIV